MDIGLIVAGLAAGTLIGLSGIGGGALMTPLLIAVAGVRPLHAVGTDLTYSALTKVVGAFRHWRLGTVDRDVALRLALGSVPGVLTGVALLRWLEAHGAADADRVISRGLGVALVLVALTLLWRLWRPAAAAGTPARLAAPVLIPLAFALGLAVGVTSVGSGSLFVVVLALATPLSMRRIVGTDVFHAALLTGAGALAHWRIGTVEPPIVANLLIGSVPGVWLGSGLAARLPRRLLSGAVATLLFASGVRLI